MKIAYLCFLHPDKVPGGQQRIAYELFREARRRHGADHAILIASDMERFPLRTADSSTLTEVAPGEFVYVTPSFEYRFFTNDDCAGQLEVVRLLESLDPDVIHFHHFLGFGMDIVPLIRAHLPRSRLVFTFHEFLSICHNNGHLRRRYDGGICEEIRPLRCQQCFTDERLDYFEQRRAFMSKVLGHFDVLSSVSRFACDMLGANLALDKPIQSVPNGPTRLEFASATARGAFPGRRGRCVIGFIGQVHPAKGVDLMLDAVTELAAAGEVDGQQLALHVYGNMLRDDDYAAKLQQRLSQARAAGLKAELKGTYSPASLATVLAELDVVVIPSLWPESYCLTVDEAVLAGKRVVCARLPSIVERLGESTGVHFFDIGSARDLRRALMDCFATLEEEVPEHRFKSPLRSYSELYESYERLYLA